MGSLLLFIAALILLASPASAFHCKSTERCSCSKVNEDYEIICPPEEQEIKVDVLIRQSVVAVQCTLNDSIWDIELFPKIETGAVETLKFSFCPLPSNGFREILQRFGINSTKHLIFHSVNDKKQISFTNGLFVGMQYLEKLKLDNNHLEYIGADVFSGLSQLVEVDLNNNRLKLPPSTFHNTPNLLQLELSQNEISQLDPKILQPLHNLKMLHLYSNKITHLDSALFQNSSNLQSLELSFNPLKAISHDLFYPLALLNQVSIRGTDLQNLPSDLFARNPALKDIRLNRNAGLRTLPDSLFLNLTNLEGVWLDDCSFASLPEDVFQGCVGLKSINLSGNELTTLHENTFRGLKKLEKLFLAGNRMNVLPARIFSDLEELVSLDLQMNRLDEINGSLFSDLIRLQEINLSRNKIRFIHQQTFQMNGDLKVIRLTDNMLTLADSPFSLFNWCINLEELHLGHNFITKIDEDWMMKTQLKVLDLQHNNISFITIFDLQLLSVNNVDVFLQNNNISQVDFSNFEWLSNDDKFSSYNLYLSDNPLNCNCEIYDLVRYLHLASDSTFSKFLTIKESFTCASPSQFYDVSVSDIKLNELTCEEKECPQDCVCKWRKFDKSYVVDCSERNLIEAPILSMPTSRRYNQTEIDLTGNNLSSAPSEDAGYGNVTKLFLSENVIDNITWIPPKVEMLTLDSNQLQYISYEVLDAMNKSETLRNLKLHNNPWNCDCTSSNFTNYLREHLIDKQVDANNITCSKDGKLLVNLNAKDLCRNTTTIILVLGIIFSLAVAAVFILLALYYRYKQEIKVWLFAHKMFLWFVTEEELDKDKQYDAFISYSHKDEHFLVNDLLPVLEDCPEPYKLCIHYRNWMAGDFIPTQIVRSVEDSRRTVVVLSEHFLESVWGKMEFRTAHKKALSEGRARVIVIIYGDVDPNKIIDEELKAYLKTNTYIKWGDPWFWNKLKYALPHSLKRQEVNSNRMHNIIKNIDKLDLINAPTTPNIGTTPPVAITLDPLLLKRSPLNFTPSAVNTPPAEGQV